MHTECDSSRPSPPRATRPSSRARATLPARGESGTPRSSTSTSFVCGATLPGAGSGMNGIGRPVGPSSTSGAAGCWAVGWAVGWGPAACTSEDAGPVRGLNGRGSLTRLSPGEVVGEGRVRTMGGISGAPAPLGPGKPENSPPPLICRSLVLRVNLSTRRQVSRAVRVTLGPGSAVVQGERADPHSHGRICAWAVQEPTLRCTGRPPPVHKPVDGTDPRSTAHDLRAGASPPRSPRPGRGRQRPRSGREVQSAAGTPSSAAGAKLRCPTPARSRASAW